LGFRLVSMGHVNGRSSSKLITKKTQLSEEEFKIWMDDLW